MDHMNEILEQAEVRAIEAIIEADDSACKGKYMDASTGRFKGGKGERFDNCVKYMTCKGGVDDPEAMCAKIARAKGAASGGKGEAIGEAVGASIVDRMAAAMLTSPKLEVLATRVFDDESQRQLFDGMIMEPLRALIAKALDAAGATVSGGLLAKAGREMKGVARGAMGEALLDELGGQRGSRGRDPYWMTAKYAGKAKDGTSFKKGDKVFYYPSTKTILAGDAADKAASEFQGAVDDERFYNQGSEW